MQKIYFLLLIILIPISFSFSQNGQTVRGRILDEASKAPIIGASIILIKDEGQMIGTTADIEGNFKLSQIPLGRQSFRVKAIGYESRQLTNIVVTSGKEVYLEITLTEAITEAAEIEIIGRISENKLVTNNEMALISGRSFNVDDTKRYAGALGDPARMAANFAGVIAGNDSRNDIVVRGNSPAGMGWQLEGLNIPNPNHFGALTSTGGPVSMLNNNVLAKSDFLTSAFPAQYGNALSGIFDLKLRNGNNEKREYLGQVGFNGFELGAEGPISKTDPKKGSYLINYRYSTLGIFNKLGIQFGTGNAVPNYQDINLKLDIPISEKVRLGVFGLGGLSDVNFEGNKEDTTGKNLYGSENENTRVKYGTGIGGLALEIQANQKTNVRLVAGYSKTYEWFEGDSISVLSREAFLSGKAKFETNKYSLNGRVIHKINAKNSLHTGFYNDFLDYKLFNSDVYQGNREVIRVNRAGNWYLGQAYAQWKYRMNSRLTISPGLHAQYTTQARAFALEPRMAIRYTLTENQTFQVGYGLHNQMQSPYSYSVETQSENGPKRTNENLGFTRSQHLVVGTERLLNETTSLKVEGYYQWIDNAPVTSSAHPNSYSALNSGNSFAPDNEDSLVNEGTGRNYGVELTLERTFSKGFYYLLTTSVFDSRYRGSDKIWRNTAFNTQFAINVLVGKEWKIGSDKQNVIALNLKGSTIGGRYLTPINFAESKIQQQAVYETNRAYSSKQDPYFRVDLKLAYRREYAKSTLEFALDLQNLTGHNNVFNQQYNRRTNTLVTQYQQGFFPVPFVRYTF